MPASRQSRSETIFAHRSASRMMACIEPSSCSRLPASCARSRRSSRSCCDFVSERSASSARRSCGCSTRAAILGRASTSWSSTLRSSCNSATYILRKSSTFMAHSIRQFSTSSAELGDASVVGFVDAAVERLSYGTLARVTRGEPGPLCRFNRAETRAPGLFIQFCHPTILRCQNGIAADRLLDRCTCVAAIEARGGGYCGGRDRLSSIELGDAPIIGASDAFGDSRWSLRRKIGARVTPCEQASCSRRTPPLPSGASLCLVECRVEDAITGAETRVATYGDFREARDRRQSKAGGPGAVDPQENASAVDGGGGGGAADGGGGAAWSGGTDRGVAAMSVCPGTKAIGTPASSST